MELELNFPALMLKSDRPVEFMHRFGKKHSRALRVLGDVAVAVGFLCMVVATVLLAKGAVDIVRGGPAQVVIVIPGVRVPGSPIYVPLLEGLVVIFLLAVFHEGMHGIMAAAQGVRSKFAALILFVFIPAAGVEIDEKGLEKKGRLEKLRIFAAGSMGNFILAALCLGLLFPAGRLAAGAVAWDGLKVLNTSNLPFDEGEVIVSINGSDTLDVEQLQAVLDRLGPGAAVSVETLNRTVVGTLNDAGKLGVYLEPQSHYTGPLGPLLAFVRDVLSLSVKLNLGVGLINLLPLSVLDGGRMAAVVSRRLYRVLSPLSLVLLLLNVLGPFVF
jgi:membrane-associated protease RseP (regulator of RpoE activity)